MLKNVAVAFVALASAQAGSTEAPPSSLRGVSLASSIEQLKECPTRANPAIPSLKYISDFEADFPPDMKGIPCFQDTDAKPLLPSASAVVIANLPRIKGAGSEVTVNLLAGKVEYVQMRFLQSYSSSILDALKSKYGKPTTLKNVVYQNGFGQTFNGSNATWVMKDAVLTFVQFDGERDWGRVSLVSNRYAHYINKSQDAAVQDIKDKL